EVAQCLNGIAVDMRALKEGFHPFVILTDELWLFAFGGWLFHAVDNLVIGDFRLLLQRGADDGVFPDFAKHPLWEDIVDTPGDNLTGDMAFRLRDRDGRKVFLLYRLEDISRRLRINDIRADAFDCISH